MQSSPGNGLNPGFRGNPEHEKETDPHVAQAIAESALFLEFSGEDVLSPDAAVQAMEQLAATLQTADEETQSSLCLQFAILATTFSGQQVTFLTGLGEALGLVKN
ncbi:hypothetical protein IYN88_15180 [Comamonas testosteroni]|nr:hypothetical protein IYN88_15180 [Comamonas testosteroni]